MNFGGEGFLFGGEGFLLGGGGILNGYPSGYGGEVFHASSMQAILNGTSNSSTISDILFADDKKNLDRNSCEKKQIRNKKPRKRKKSKLKDDTPSKKVKLKIFLERFDTGVYVTKVRVEDRERWQNVKYEKQALRFHSALKRFQKVMSAVETMKVHKTLDVCLTKDELLRYKAGDLLEGVDKSNTKRKAVVRQEVIKPKPKRKSGVVHQQVNNYYHINNYYNAGPSTSKRCIEVNYNESSDSESITYHFSDSSTE